MSDSVVISFQSYNDRIDDQAGVTTHSLPIIVVRS